jgi:hypothetical protein
MWTAAWLSEWIRPAKSGDFLKRACVPGRQLIPGLCMHSAAETNHVGPGTCRPSDGVCSESRRPISIGEARGLVGPLALQLIENGS